MRFLLLTLALSACGFVDQLDGHIDNQQNCCAELTYEAIQQCMIDLAPPDHEGWCWEAQCSAPIGKVSARQWEGQEIERCEP